ncbi:MAG: hypothetical protein JO319_19760 [Acidobacteriaceae bacterium]|nr:hypothetical protein [Acidobacteriaceae bacterium]
MGVITSPLICQRVQRCRLWPELLPAEQWSVYKAVIVEAYARDITFAVGGGLSAMTYAGQWRNTKDIDLYVAPAQRERLIGVLRDLRLRDYYEKQAYDRSWIYRSYTADTIVDVMWAMANQRAQVDETWFDGPEVEVDGLCIRLLAPEKSLWTKLYVIQRDRTDWPDALNLLYGVGMELNWRGLLNDVAQDRALLVGLLSVFAWLCPRKAELLPAWLWSELAMQPPPRDRLERDGSRAALLDSRPWFSPFLAEANDGTAEPKELEQEC